MNLMHVIIQDTKFYPTYIDGTHFSLSNDYGSPFGAVYHIGQMKGEPHYDALKTWLDHCTEFKQFLKWDEEKLDLSNKVGCLEDYLSVANLMLEKRTEKIDLARIERDEVKTSRLVIGGVLAFVALIELVLLLGLS